MAKKTASKAKVSKDKKEAKAVLDERTATPDQKLAEISKEVVKMEEQAAKLKVTNEEEASSATTFLSGIKARLKRIEELRVFFVKPLNDQVKAINAKFAEQSDPLENAERVVKRAIGDYTMEQHRRARAEEERLAKLREKQNERRDEKGLDPILTPLPTVARPEATIKTDGGKATTTLVWKFEVQVPSQVPVEYMTVDESKIRKAVQAGIREIAGVRIYEDVQVGASAR